MYDTAFSDLDSEDNKAVCLQNVKASHNQNTQEIVLDDRFKV